MTLLRVVDRDGTEHEVDAKTGITLMENLRDLDYGVAAVCGGMCACATCHVYVDPEWAARRPAPHSDETDLLGAILYLIAHEAPETFFEYVADIEADRDDTRKVWLEEAMPEGRA